MRTGTWWIVLAATLAAVSAGCGQGKETRLPESGNPEADQRAQLRVGGGTDDNAQAPRPTLYDRLGGEKTIAALVDDVTDRVIADPRVNFARVDVTNSWWGGTYEPWHPTPRNVELFKKHMVEFLTLATGGPAKYTGRDIRDVHKGMRITNTEFDAMIGDITTSMDRLKIPPELKKDLLAVFETTRKEIVEKR
jgi:hemoglobin